MNKGFETALRLTFGERAEFHAVLRCALRRGAGDLVSLALLENGTLWLCITPVGTAAPGTALLTIPAPRGEVSEEALDLRIAVVDWRGVARQYDTAQLLRDNGEKAP